jgi:hypothetical protein
MNVAMPASRTSPDEALTEAPRRLLDARRDRAERLLNAVRAVVLVLLATAALAYAPSLPPALNRANVLVLVPMLAWTACQYALFYRAPALPGWLGVVNPLLDITAVTVIMGSYGLAASASLALKSPMFLAYFVILAARPIASSTRKAAAVAILVVIEYAALVLVLSAMGRVVIAATPITASTGSAVSPLDESAKLLFLIVAGAVAIYATSWHERLATSYYRESHERAQMGVRLAHARLESLKLQMHPHFLFNTLNTITALISTAPLTAERVVTGLSELLRVSLHNAGEQEVPLERELELLEPYLEIQQIRFQDRLAITLSVAPDSRKALVPNLILQPLVENAIRHGIAPRASGGRVDIDARCENGVLHLRVTDDGVGLTHAGDRPPADGVGLGNTRARLQYLYGSQHQFQLHGGPHGGFAVDISIPFHLAPVDTAAAKESA